ncbi:MAG: hypothetical protein R3189_05885 [Thiomicrorhabdus chilensis]|uniref:hypothetical protein n=1 Tax=Thiomicrorhabdus chilensis TaxID=63656 RepID=UPI00299D9D94|nr:hypothetical protein [Thiomicrorhabdus chilensis]MDX1347762.1 hypothetical protein [Thiomicrorhabdus chilensis]
MLNPISNSAWLHQNSNDVKSDNTASDKLNLGSLLQAKQKADLMASAKLNPQDLANKSDSARLSTSAMQHMEQAYQYSETMSLQLTTREGDQVSVDFRQLYAQYQSFKSEQQAEQGPEGVRYFESRETMEVTAFEERFAFSVQGELNEDELKAVFEVFEQVDGLANEFYNGDLEVAMQKAMELDMDSSQLQSLQLNMTQSTVVASRYQQSAMAQYEAMQREASLQPASEGEASENAKISDLPPYLQKWQQAVDRLDEQFEEAQNFLDQLMAKVSEQRFPQQDESQESSGWLERIRDFHQQLSQLMAAEKPGAKEALEPSKQALEMSGNNEKLTEKISEKTAETV